MDGGTGGSGHRARLDRGGREGWGVRLPAAVSEDPAWRTRWADVRSVTVRVRKGRLLVEPAVPLPASPQDPEHEAALEEAAFQEASQARLPPDREVGRLRWFDPQRGYGFIDTPSGEDRFFHHSGLSCDPTELESGLPVDFETRPGARGPVAVNVRRLSLGPDGRGAT